MKNKFIVIAFASLAVVALATLAFAFVRGSRVDSALPSPSVSFGSTTMLSIGKSLEFEDGLRVTLTAVNDSRCPKDVQCIWQGELSPVIELSGGANDAAATVTLGTERTRSSTAGPYAVTLVGATETTATFVVYIAKD